MIESKSPVVAAAETYVSDFIKTRISPDYLFHDLYHTREVVESVTELAKGYDLPESQCTLLQLAAWFHDTGYSEGAEGHEERGCKNARDFLANWNLPEEDLQLICDCIMATKVPQRPDTLFEELLCDADMSHLGMKSYWDRCGRLRQEFLITKEIMMSEQEWVDFEIDFMTNHRYHTSFAQELYDRRKHKHIQQLIKQKLRLDPREVDTPETLAKVDLERKKAKDKFSKKLRPSELELKELRLGRGVETMFRTAYRTHVNLSAIADNKANIMLSINAIIISIVVSTLVPKFESNPKLMLPTLVLLAVCLIAMTLATLSTRPKVTKGIVSREDIENRRGNLMFFGNFYRMPLEDYDWGIKEMIRDDDYLYGTMTRDLYFLGIVLAKKYRYLSYCYTVFMFGLIAAVLAFALAFML